MHFEFWIFNFFHLSFPIICENSLCNFRLLSKLRYDDDKIYHTPYLFSTSIELLCAFLVNERTQDDSNIYRKIYRKQWETEEDERGRQEDTRVLRRKKTFQSESRWHKLRAYANCYELLCTFVKLFDIYNIVNMNRCLNNKLNVNLFKCKQ